jgi:type IV pilus assembly protein PilM
VASKKRILALDAGTSKIMLAEFIVEGDGIKLANYAVKPLDSLSQEAGMRTLYSLSGDVRDLMAENGIKPGPVYMALSGQSVFPRYVKLPPVAADKIDEMLQYEAQENLPFPLEEVVWDYQVLPNGIDEVDALIIATKRDTAQEVIQFGEQTKLRVEVIDSVPFALYNSMLFNYPEDEGCAILLDIGARSTNLVFSENGNIFTRSITVAGNTITNEIARGLSISAQEAEELKKEIGVVALGGNYAVAGDEVADKVSKIIRSVVTRLHSEVDRSINFYRSKQGGSVPVKLYLTGGASLTRHIDTFFREKLDLEVEYLNPFKNVPVAPGLEEDSETLYLMASSVGLALRGGVKCPIELNLMPAEILDERRFAGRLPFFGVAVVGLVLTLLCWFIFAAKQEEAFNFRNDTVQERIAVRRNLQGQIDTIKNEADEFGRKCAYLAELVAARGSFAEVMEAIRAAMLPDTWLTELYYETDANNVTYANIIVRGYKKELDERVNKYGGSAAELMVTSILRNKECFNEEGTKILSEKSVENDLLSELNLKVALKRTPGVIDGNWSERWIEE